MKKLSFDVFKKFEIKSDILKKIKGGNTTYGSGAGAGTDNSINGVTYMDDGRCFCNDELVMHDRYNDCDGF